MLLVKVHDAIDVLALVYIAENAVVGANEDVIIGHDHDSAAARPDSGVNDDHMDSHLGEILVTAHEREGRRVDVALQRVHEIISRAEVCRERNDSFLISHQSRHGAGFTYARAL